MEMRDFRITMENLPLLLEMLDADEEWMASLTTEDKQKLIDKANEIIKQHYGNPTM